MTMHRKKWSLALMGMAAGCASMQADAPAPDWRLGLPACLYAPYEPPCFSGDRTSASLFRDSDPPGSAPGSLHSLADPNARPVFVRAVGDRRAVSDLYFTGHAEMQCCLRVSDALHRRSLSHDLDTAWLSYGVGHFTATSARGRKELAAAVQEIEALQDGPACAGQVDAKFSTDAPADMAADLSAKSRRARDLAVDLGRPVLAWHELQPGSFMLAPMLVADLQGRLQPLTITLPVGLFDYPTRVHQESALDGVGAYIDSLRRAIASSRQFKAIRGKTARFERVVSAVHAIVYTGHLDPTNRTMLSAIESASRQMEDILKENDALLALKLRPGDSRGAAAWVGFRVERSKFGEALRAHVQANQRVVQAMREGTSSRGPKRTWYTDIRIEHRPLDFLQEWAVEAERALPGLELELERATRLVSRPPGDPIPALVDASLRGWPATMRSAEAEELFDRWQQTHQNDVWNEFVAQLRATGAVPPSPGDPIDLFRSSNLVFRIERVGQSLRIVPTYVLAGGFYIVADPGSRLVRYEAAIAEQNLERSGGALP